MVVMFWRACWRSSIVVVSADRSELRAPRKESAKEPLVDEHVNDWTFIPEPAHRKWFLSFKKKKG
jgi:hypothetical protein